RPAKHTPVLTIAACPKAVTEQDQVMPRCVLLAGKVPSQNRPNAEHRKKRGRYARDRQPFWFTLAGNLAPFVAKCSQFHKQALVARKNIKVRRGEAHFRKAHLRNALAEGQQPCRILERQGSKQYRVHHAEDGSVRADAKRQ